MLAWIAGQSAYLELAAGLQGTYHCASLLARCADHGDQFSIVGCHGSVPSIDASCSRARVAAPLSLADAPGYRRPSFCSCALISAMRCSPA